MGPRFNPPPSWPTPPPGWQPAPGWQPPPGWGPAPPGWPLWVDEAPAPVRHPAGIPLRVAAAVVVTLLVAAAAADSGLGGALVILGVTGLFVGFAAVVVRRARWAFLGSR